MNLNRYLELAIRETELAVALVLTRTGAGR